MLAALLLVLVARHSELAWSLMAIACGVVLIPQAATSRSVYGLFGIFLWSLFAMELHDRLGSTGQLLGVLVVYISSTLIVRWMTSTQALRSWVMAQAVGIVLAETFLVLLFWPVNFPSQALMMTAVGFLGLEIIERSDQHTIRARELFIPVVLIAIAITGTVLTANWLEY